VRHASGGRAPARRARISLRRVTMPYSSSRI